MLASAFAAGGEGMPPFRFTKKLVLEYHATLTQQTIMEKEIIMFKHD